MKSSAWSWDALLIASIVLVAGLCAQSQQAAHAKDETSPAGKIVRISPDAEVGEPIPLAIEEEVKVVEEPLYWIGISGRPVESPVLRTHLQLSEDMGIVVEQVVPDSPADKAGLRQHDIILRVNGAGVHGMKVLQDHVRDHQAKPLELKLIRLGADETVVVVPEERPADLRVPLAQQGQGRRNGLGGRPDAIAKLLEQLQAGGGLQGGIQRFAPGGFMPGQQPRANALPNGVSVSIQRENDGPAKITVKRGDETWHIVGDDPKSLEQLPEDLRPFVQDMLQGNQAAPGNLGFNWEAELEHFLPERFGALQRRMEQRPVPAATPAEQEMRQRMERLEKELHELQKRLAEE